MRVGFVCTNFNNASLTRAAVASLQARSRPEDAVAVVVVDNNSNDDDVAALEEMALAFPDVALVLSRENVGYFPGLNLGIRHLRRTWTDVQHLVVGNNDLVFPENFVAVLREHRDVLDRWAVVAPDIVGAGGLHENPHVARTIGKARRRLWDVYHHSYGAAVVVGFAARVTRRLTAREETQGNPTLHTVPGPIDQGYGACYLLGPCFFRHFSALCAPTFLMQEEYFLTEQLKLIGQLPYFDPRFVVHHRGHASTKTVPGRRRWSMSADAHRVYRRYQRMSPAEQKAFVGEHSGLCVPGRHHGRMGQDET